MPRKMNNLLTAGRSPLAKWRQRFVLLGAGLLSLLTVGTQAFADEAPQMRAYFGTYTRDGGSRGIYVSELDLGTGKLSAPRSAAETVNPSFLAIDPEQRYLYSVAEVETSDGKRGGGVAAFAIDAASGALELLNKQSSGGTGPCHLVTDRQGKCVLVANYGGGSVASLPVQADGRLAEAASFIQHQGSSVNPQRQEGPHAHSINVDAANRFAFAADLGADKVFVYRLNAEQGTLAPNDPPYATVNPGAGPRHFAFHPSGKFAYVINELQSTVTAFKYDAQHGSLEELQTISTLPEDFQGENTTAEVQVDPSGKYLYGSNRGHNSLAAFKIDAQTGKLAPIGRYSTKGKIPRNFGIDPTGQFILAANQDSDSVVVLRLDPKTGALQDTGRQVEVPMPVCVKFMKVE
jgi:6-phosphogluconolactonase